MFFDLLHVHVLVYSLMAMMSPVYVNFVMRLNMMDMMRLDQFMAFYKNWKYGFFVYYSDWWQWWEKSKPTAEDW